MKKIFFIATIITALLVAGNANAQTPSDTSKPTQKKYQAKAPATQPFGKEAFGKSTKTTLKQNPPPHTENEIHEITAQSKNSQEKDVIIFKSDISRNK